MNKFESPAMTARATIKVNVLKNTALLCNRLEENFDYNYPKQAGSRQYTVTTGRKYHKIIADWCGRYLYARDVKFAHLK